MERRAGPSDTEARSGIIRRKRQEEPMYLLDYPLAPAPILDPSADAERAYAEAAGLPYLDAPEPLSPLALLELILRTPA
jgi:hypothetical protein